MDTTSILAKTAKGIAAKPEKEGLTHDGVRLMRLINGKASIGELRARFADLTDVRFETAITALQRKGLVHVVKVSVQAPGDDLEKPGFDAKMHELQQEVMQSLDFTTLQRTLLDAMRSAPAKTDSTAPTTSKQPAATLPAIKSGATLQPDAKVRPPPDSRPPQEAEIREQLIAALRPKVEDELRTTLASALRPALEAEIRSKLIAALKPRVEQELRARLNAELAQRANVAAAANAPLQQLLACLQETVFQNDLVGKIVYVNPAWTRLTGASTQDAIGRQFADFFTPADQKAITLFLDRIARGKETPPGFEARLTRKSGGLLRIELRAAPLTTAAGGTIGVCGTLHVPNAALEDEQ